MDIKLFAGPNAHVSSSMPSQKKHAMAKQVDKKENATLRQRIEILDWHYANGKVQTKTVKHFRQVYPNLRLTQPRISEWLKKESTLHTELESSGGHSHSLKRVHQTQHPC